VEILKRKLKVEREENQNKFIPSLADKGRLTLRWQIKEDDTEDLLINLTREETKKIRNCLTHNRF